MSSRVSPGDGALSRINHPFIFQTALVQHNITGVTAAGLEEIKRKSGETVTLYTGVLRKPSDVIIWYFNDNVVVEVTPMNTCTDDQCKNGTGRFKNRQELDNQTGSLTIRDLTFRDSGVFKLKINGSIEKSFEVYVNPPGLSSRTVTAIYAGMFGSVVVSYIVVSISVMLVAVIITGGVIYCCHGKRENDTRIQRNN